ncbi:endonuclease VII domain-containing protein [Trujillonella endophytica]|uniref:Recombination endonuclease VII n=1 Tax=Trujillonella endophytica TaxID=673521 RepID=A0A1H8QQD3_9ACTN|nr:endonuclease VII domain-containing protein [Trujillella endophytica]SEO56256.1 Recombination endonuclease VII [Trujillella endophytica]
MAERRQLETFGCTRCSRVLPGTAFHAGNGVQAVSQPCKECKSTIKTAATRERRVSGGRAPYHLLSEVDPEARKAVCRECGPVHIYATGTKAGRGWRCGARSDEISDENYAAREDIADKFASKKWHRIRNVDGAAMRGECSQCGDVPVGWNQSGQYFVCKSPARKRRHADAERRRRRLLQYGLTPEEYEEMKEAQGGVCAICGGTSARADGDGALVIDHDHGTGRVRALLCNLCNAGIGHLRDDPKIMLAAIEYVTFHAARLTQEDS